MTLPITEIQSLSPSAVIELFVLDATAIGGSVYYFHPGTNGLGTSVVWQGVTYAPFPVQMDGFEWSSKGTLPRPTLTVAALDGLVGGLVHTLNDLVGATVTFKRTFAKYLDAVHFTGGVNATADPAVCFPDEPWKVERKALETADIIQFELATPMDIQGAQIPRRRVLANLCAWTFKGTECGYAGATATCAKTLAACKTNFGATTPLPFGAFPGTARVR